MTVEELLKVYNNCCGANYGVLDEKNTLYLYEHNRKQLINDFGDRVIKCFEFENESVVGLLISIAK